MTHRMFVYATRIVVWSDGTANPWTPHATRSWPVSAERGSREILVQVRGERWTERDRRFVRWFRRGRG